MRNLFIAATVERVAHMTRREVEDYNANWEYNSDA